MESSPMSLFEKFIKEAYGSQYVIPVYQRNYTWKKNKQVKQLISDIERILTGETKRHFIGTIVYVITNTDFMVRERAVVDGQQRLITMFLCVYALKNIAEQKNELDIAKILRTSYLENNDEEKYKYRLKPSVSDDDAYKYITEDRIDEYVGTSQIMDNYKYIYDEFDKLVSQYGIMKVINAIRELYIVRIELDQDDDAQQIFESINSTGEKLTSADLIRNYILMNKDSDEQERIYNKYWLKLEKIFTDSKKVTEFIRFYLASKTYILSSEKDLYTAFKIYWENKLEDVEYDIILEELLNYAKHFERLYITTKDFDELGAELKDYKKLQSLMPAPFTMFILELYRKENITQKQTQDILKLINTYLMRRYLCGQDTSAISRYFPGLLKNVESQLKVEESYGKIVDICTYYVVNENRGKSASMPDDYQIQTYLKTANAYSLSNIRWVLEKIELYKNPAPVNLNSLNVEHIMPQTANEYWKEVSGLNEEDYVNVINRIGNLTLASSTDNSKMGNRDFEYKKSVLEETKHLKLNENILIKHNWTVSDIDERSDKLVNQIIEILPYPRTSYVILGKDKNRNIYLNSKSITANGYLNENNSVTIFADSQVKFDVLPNSETLKELRDDLLEQEIIEHKNGVVKFNQNFTFSSISSATDFILGGSNNGWNYWKDENDIVINISLRNQNN